MEAPGDTFSNRWPGRRQLGSGPEAAAAAAVIAEIAREPCTVTGAARLSRRALMSMADVLLPEFDQEMAVTRRVLERVPSERGTWKPHPKSFALGHLAQLVSWMPGWITNALQETELNLATAGGYSFESTETLLATFDRNVTAAREEIARTKDDAYAVPWSLKHGDRVLFTMPRAGVVRQTVNHLVHHRAQLGVYLRLLDVPVPSMYGPTADEGWDAATAGTQR
jgi:uncharacterized damage-inducible protein DinB